MSVIVSAERSEAKSKEEVIKTEETPEKSKRGRKKVVDE